MCICGTKGDILLITSGKELLSLQSQKLGICLAALWWSINSDKCGASVCTDAVWQWMSWPSPSHGAPGVHKRGARPRV